MHVRVRLCGEPDVVVSVESKLTKIDKFRVLVQEKFNVKPNNQRLFYGGKLLENGYTFHDYKIKLNDVIQLMARTQPLYRQSSIETTDSEKDKISIEETNIEYNDAVSMFYTVGDFIDMRDTERGAWFEGVIMRIVRDPADINLDKDQPNKENENDPQIKQPPVIEDKPKNGIEKFFGKIPKHPQSSEHNGMFRTEDHLLYKVQTKNSYEISNTYCKLKDIRPRARIIVAAKDLKIGQKVMVNHNFEHFKEIGHWYDFKVSEIVSKRRNIYELKGTVYLGPDSVPQNDITIRVLDKLFIIEEVIPLEDRTEEYKELMKTEPEKRSAPLNCLFCRDKEDRPCQDCGCFLCSGKQFPEKILLCDECNKGFHMECLEPPLTELPEGDWYCMWCKRDTTQVVAPGAAKQKKQEVKTNRDWGRGMACVGKTKTCSMPSNHFGPIPGIDVGMCWRFRIQLSESGVHRPPVSGIHGKCAEGAYSIVLSGGYEDDFDNGNEFTYTGSGGRDLSGNKRTAEQSSDQTLHRQNMALARNCAVQLNEEGNDAGEDWRKGRPVRVVRSFKMRKHFPEFAPEEGIRYDGIYKVVKYYPEKGKSGFRVWKYLLRRDDPSPAPWEAGAKHYDIIYPDGHLEAAKKRKAPEGDEACGTSSATLKRGKLAKEKSQLKHPKTSPTVSVIDMLMTSPTHIKNGETEPDENKNRGKDGTIATAPVQECPDTCAEKENKCRDGHKEVEAEKNALKEMNAEGSKGKSRQHALKKSNHPASDGRMVALLERMVTPSESIAVNRNAPEVNEACGTSSAKPMRGKLVRQTKVGIASNPIKNGEEEPDKNNGRGNITISKEEQRLIAKDTLNRMLWSCLNTKKNKKDFIENVRVVFQCIICQDIAAIPVTTPCLHNFCLSCLKQMFKRAGTQVCPCPYCRRSLSMQALKPNEQLIAALRAIMPGYDANRS